MNIVNINTNVILTESPKTIRFNGKIISDPSEEQLKQAGWYPFEERATVPKNHRVITRSWVVEDGMAVEQLTTELRIPSYSLLQTATVFRLILRSHFGPNAETNQDITESAIKLHFLQKRENGTITPTDSMDAVALLDAFTAIKGWTGDGTSWSFPWELLDEPLVTTTTTSTTTSTTSTSTTPEPTTTSTSTTSTPEVTSTTTSTTTTYEMVFTTTTTSEEPTTTTTTTSE